MMLVLVFNSRKRYRVNLVFPFHDVFLYFIFSSWINYAYAYAYAKAHKVCSYALHYMYYKY